MFPISHTSRSRPSRTSNVGKLPCAGTTVMTDVYTSPQKPPVPIARTKLQPSKSADSKAEASRNASFSPAYSLLGPCNRPHQSSSSRPSYPPATEGGHSSGLGYQSGQQNEVSQQVHSTSIRHSLSQFLGRPEDLENIPPTVRGRSHSTGQRRALPPTGPFLLLPPPSQVAAFDKVLGKRKVAQENAPPSTLEEAYRVSSNTKRRRHIATTARYSQDRQETFLYESCGPVSVTGDPPLSLRLETQSTTLPLLAGSGSSDLLTVQCHEESAPYSRLENDTDGAANLDLWQEFESSTLPLHSDSTLELVTSPCHAGDGRRTPLEITGHGAISPDPSSIPSWADSATLLQTYDSGSESDSLLHQLVASLHESELGPDLLAEAALLDGISAQELCYVPPSYSAGVALPDVLAPAGDQGLFGRDLSTQAPVIPPKHVEAASGITLLDASISSYDLYGIAFPRKHQVTDQEATDSSTMPELPQPTPLAPVECSATVNLVEETPALMNVQPQVLSDYELDIGLEIFSSCLGENLPEFEFSEDLVEASRASSSRETFNGSLSLMTEYHSTDALEGTPVTAATPLDGNDEALAVRRFLQFSGDPERQFACIYSECKETFRLCNMMAHLTSHGGLTRGDGETVKCPAVACTSRPMKRDSIQKHIMDIHLKARQIRCPMSGCKWNASTDYYGRNRHIINVHSKKAPEEKA
ncbi:hypothetical protein OE88DRAFT_1808851 [Heliocybe sulcata]|uniref:C2H2-type domain-containing protein n=1 Tax=Heliocybe sulcata TaxID=5364 RepID=A0A5C3N0K0_9AGAM|nr:hypothetical protein OE88DRAFT_1808851 [Heliocybe sulcata]